MRASKGLRWKRQTGKNRGAGGKSRGSFADSGWRSQLCRHMYLWVNKQQGLGGVCCCCVVMLHVFNVGDGSIALTLLKPEGARPPALIGDPRTGRHRRIATKKRTWRRWRWGWNSPTAGRVSLGCEPRVSSFTNVDWVVGGLQVLSSLVFIVYSEPVGEGDCRVWSYTMLQKCLSAIHACLSFYWNGTSLNGNVFLPPSLDFSYFISGVGTTPCIQQHYICLMFYVAITLCHVATIISIYFIKVLCERHSRAGLSSGSETTRNILWIKMWQSMECICIQPCWVVSRTTFYCNYSCRCAEVCLCTETDNSVRSDGALLQTSIIKSSHSYIIGLDCYT